MAGRAERDRCTGRVTLGALALLALIAGAAASASDSAERLFPTDLPALQWTEFQAAGFSQPVAGMILRTDKPACCGVPLGGIGTGCLDIDTLGTFGFCAVFHQYPRKPKLYQPFLGLAVGGKTWVLAAQQIIDGGDMPGCIDEMMTDPYNPKPRGTHIPQLVGVEAAREIHYFGHYPVADLEYETDAPVSVGLRAWAPFIPGDAHASNIPGAVFEVHLRNPGQAPQEGTIAFSFPGPTEAEAGPDGFERQRVETAGFSGAMVRAGDLTYAVGMIGNGPVRLGGGLDADPPAWGRIAQDLPEAYPSRPGTSAAVDFSLAPGEAQVIRFVLTWYVPEWGEPVRYIRMYAARYSDAADVAADLAGRHADLLRRVLAWQQAIYTARETPAWLRETLVNNLCMIPEDSYWAQSNPPLEWAGENGLYGMMECPRACPQIECIPCSWYGNIPIVYFFPELARSTLRGYMQYQAENGAAPFAFGPREEMWAPGHAWQNQISLNGVCYVDMVDRLWLRTGDDGLLREFYDSVKKSTTLTALIGEPPESVISMPPGGGQTEWFEASPWTGMTAHVGGMHLSNMAIAERMARKMGDHAFAEQCREWLAQGQKAMEEKMWAGDTYLLMWNVNTGKREDTIMANQLDAEWANASHGLPGVFRPDRVPIVLDTIKKTCLMEPGAGGFASHETGKLDLTVYNGHMPGSIIIAMTYMYRDRAEEGLEIARKTMDNQVRKQRYGWDLACGFSLETGQRFGGTDYYQNMILWALPAALQGKDLTGPCQPGGLVDRVLRAAKSQEQ